MKDMDFSMVEKVKDILDYYGVQYQEKVSGLIYILVENDNQLAMFLFYGFFEEYVIYERDNSEADWVLKTRNELNFSFTTVENVLALIGIET